MVENAPITISVCPEYVMMKQVIVSGELQMNRVPVIYSATQASLVELILFGPMKLRA